VLDEGKMLKTLRKLLLFDKHICPWWLCYTFDNPLRRLVHKPERMLGPYVHEGQTVLDIGAGMGYFSIPLAKMVGEKGLVIAADVQKEMLDRLAPRAVRAGVEKQITTHLCEKDRLGITCRVDFVLAFWVVHEVDNKESLFEEIFSILCPGGKLLVAEPKIHTSLSGYRDLMAIAEKAGFRRLSEPHVFMSWASLLTPRK
jgi:ubiquinone/menaquinone biosynthesis C-methylase UbiE